MVFYKAFLRTLMWRPRQALEALYWHVTGRRVRARNRLRINGAQSPFAYQLWIESIEGEAAPPALAGQESLQQPLFSVIFHDSPDLLPGQRERSLAALCGQCWQQWELVLIRAPGSPAPFALDVPRLTLVPGLAESDAEALAAGIAAANGAFVLPLPAGAVLPPHALLRYAGALADDTGAVEVIYGDQDEISARGHRARPWFKPRWNPEMFLAQDYISDACVIRTTRARAALPLGPAATGAASYALLLAIARPETLGEPVPARIVHLPQVLAHLPARGLAARQDARAAAVAAHLAGRAAAVRPGAFGSIRVDWPLPEPAPLVSIIVPTRDQLRLLRNCVNGVLTRTRYRPFEVIIVDNGSREPETLAYLARVADNPQVRVLAYDAPFNFSAINNFAARHAQGRYLCLLNNDIEIIDENWLGALMRQAVRPEVGAAGAKLLYEDGTIQHAGVVIGLGEAAGHAHRFQRDDDPGYFARAHVAHRASAVTAACLVVEKAKFEAVGGFDEDHLAVAFNDVDLCLKLDRAGWCNLYVPQAVAVHHESKSRGRDFLPANIDRYMSELAVLQERWATRDYRDPLHHPHLDEYSETYVIQLGP
ncbi:MAG: glycosyltransferase family 2 protein [Sphingomonadales bacterium]|nr:glycosyltransferase family 2 protein [Sphingomonadales bacterium]